MTKTSVYCGCDDGRALSRYHGAGSVKGYTYSMKAEGAGHH